jgi:ArsR family transcriptional regulator, arsenate/arsenite/antimonite-responsive transcriptional repressor
MKSSNKKYYPPEDVKIARFAKALGHPARIAILRHLASLETCCFNEISKEIPLADSTVSQHLSELKNAGLIQGSFDPPRVQYCINYENWKISRKYLKEFTKIRVLKNEKDK